MARRRLARTKKRKVIQFRRFKAPTRKPKKAGEFDGPFYARKLPGTNKLGWWDRRRNPVRMHFYGPDRLEKKPIRRIR